MTAPELSAVMIRPMRGGDWPAVQRIYIEGIATGHATFEQSAPDWDRFNSSRLPCHRFVAETTDGRILGWAAVSPVSVRPVYSGVVEHSVYIAAEAAVAEFHDAAAAGDPAACDPERICSYL